jgi:hypothetical protein
MTTGLAAPTSPAAPACSGLKDRAEALGGRLRLDSPRGAGTTLEITLPASDPAPAGREPPPGAASLPATDPGHAGFYRP